MENNKLCATKHEERGREGDGITKRTYMISYAVLNTSSLLERALWRPCDPGTMPPTLCEGVKLGLR